LERKGQEEKRWEGVKEETGRGGSKGQVRGKGQETEGKGS
jgi:hypothetical protein